MRKWGTGSVIYPVIGPRDIVVRRGDRVHHDLRRCALPALKAARIKPLEALNYI